MERIKKALELARQARGQGHTATKPLEPPQTPALAQPPVDFQARTVPVPLGVLEQNRVLTGLKDRTLTGAYKLLRTQVLQRMQQNGWSTLAVTGPREKIGKTLTAVNLAVSLAGSVNYTVFLVDLDLRRPGLHALFGYQPQYGIGDHLFRSVPLGDIAFSPGIERLTILPEIKPIEHSSEVLSSPAMRQFVNSLKGRNSTRIVVFDLPPLLAGDDVLAFSPLVDALLLVIEDGKTRREDLSRLLELVKDVSILGTVLNKSTHVSESDYAYYRSRRAS